jgi:hypothetical protein
VVAVHGQRDRPEWACSGWRAVTKGRAFIVCPEGVAVGAHATGGYYWPSTTAVGRAVDRAVDAVRARFGAYVEDGPMVYAGFSAGVIYGSGFVRDAGERFPLLMLSEGGYDELASPSFAKRFRASGGRRVLLGCSSGGCAATYERARKLLDAAGVAARVNDAGNVGHNLDAPVVRSLQRDWPWLVEGEPGW